MTATIREQIRALLEQEEAARLAAGAAAGHRVADHQPRMYLVPGGWALGCSCGEKPARRSARMSMMHVWFGGHVRRLGLPRFDRCGGDVYGEAVYADGPATGLTWDAARARGINING